MNDEMEIPEAASESRIEVGGITLRIYHLEDGRRIIHADDFDELAAAIQSGEFVPTADDFETIAESVGPATH